MDRLRKLPAEVDADNTGRPMSDSRPTSQPDKRRRADNAATATRTQCTETASCTDSELSRPLTRPTDNHSDHDSNVCMDSDSSDTGDLYLLVTVSQSTDAATAAAAAAAESATNRDRPCPVPTSRPMRERRRPARFLETIQAHRLTYRNSAAHACYRSAGGDFSVTS